ncbi:hypothetical protein [Streptomyces hygroscopicus]|uniref:hypothetical protein n=1 Tax=Streptomyces hygroscopicus TaxID=1912 RepID=UPI00223FD9C8|nr:hypothetical protein [Streptomyces hygroscopicus]
MLTLVCPGEPADPLGSAPDGVEQVAVDGKSARGSGTDTDDVVHVLSALTGTGRVISQLRCRTRPPGSPPRTHCGAFDLTGATVTADALHTTREQARYLVEEKNAHFVLVVKRNQPHLNAMLRPCPAGDAQRCATTASWDTDDARPARCACSPSPAPAWTSRISRRP